MELLDILQRYPFLIPNRSFSFWEGIITLKGEEVPIKIDIPHYPSLEDASVSTDIKYTDIFQCVLELCKQVKDGSFMKFLDSIQNCDNKLICDTLCDNTILKDKREVLYSTEVNMYHRYNNILSEIKDIGLNNVEQSSGDLNYLKLRAVDAHDRVHVIEFSVPSDYPQSPPKLSKLELPDVVVSQITQCASLKEMYSVFCSLISKLQDFWNSYELLCSKAWVIDPEQPMRKDVHCRIVVGENVSILININPLDVEICPEIRFLGSENAVLPLRNTAENNLKELGWDEDLNICDNLLQILNLDRFPQRSFLPSSETATKSFYEQGVCCICFTLRLDNEDLLPTKMCNNSKCVSRFHITCLAQWFQSVPTNIPSFNLISGECPSCGERILCPIKIT